MNFGEIVNFLLYAFSGICFGAFASRYSVFSALHIKSKWQEEGISCLFGCLPQLLFLSVSFFFFRRGLSARLLPEASFITQYSHSFSIKVCA